MGSRFVTVRVSEGIKGAGIEGGKQNRVEGQMFASLNPVCMNSKPDAGGLSIRPPGLCCLSGKPPRATDGTKLHIVDKRPAPP